MATGTALHGMMRRVVSGLVLVAALAVMTDADAQRKRMPVRTEPIPDTETGAKAGSAGSDDERPNPGMMIFGPPTPVLGAPPPPPVPSAAPAPADTPPAAIPAPVVTPVPAPPAPIAVPVPAPAPIPPPAPVAAPAPAPVPPPAPVAAPVPTPVPPPPPMAAPVPTPVPPPPPVAAPAPAPVPPPPPLAAPAPAPVPPPSPVAAPAPAPVPPPAPVAAPAPAPVPPPAPVAAPARKPAPVVAPIVAIARPAPPAGPPKLDAKLVEQIFSCLAPGLPQDWKRTWVVITSAAPAPGAKFYYTSSLRDEDAQEFVPCNVQEITRRITGLNESLPPAQRRWTSARLAISSEGDFEMRYDYSK